MFWDVLAAGCGAGITDTTLNPLEVIKVRVQAPGQTLYRNPLHCARSILQTDGLAGLWCPGLVATWIRSFTYTATRLGLYPTMRDFYRGELPRDEPLKLWQQLAAGMTTGSIASCLFSPVELVRIRLTFEAGRLSPGTGLLTSGLRAGERPRYSHTGHAFVAIARDEGLRGLWSGAGAHVARAAVLSGTQLASYDSFKGYLRGLGVEETPSMHLSGAFFSGFVAQTCAMPVDTIRTRVMAGAHGSISGCVRETMATEGVRGFFRGYLPALSRQCPVMLMQMPLVEQIRRLLGMDYI